MGIDELRKDCAYKQKKGLHFIMASVVIWTLILGIQLTDLPILTKNFLTFCATAPLMPLAYAISKLIKVDFTNKENPLTKLGLLFSLNQMLYLLIAMWVYPTVPDKMLMVLAMIFGAHLLPYGWLYQSKAYYGFSLLISFSALVVGLLYRGSFVAGMMIVYEIAFCLSLFLEVQRLSTGKQKEQSLT